MQNMTETIKKFDDAEAFPRMRGTEGNMDYLVIAKRPDIGMQLGIKVLCGPGSIAEKQGFIVGVRIRSAKIPGYGGNITEIGAEPVQSVTPDDAWDLPWESLPNHQAYRASLVRVVCLARGPDDIKWVLDDLDSIRFFSKLMLFLQDKVAGEHFVVTEQDVSDYIKASLYPTILTLQANYDPRKALELLELTWETKIKNHAAFEEHYKAQKAELEAKIATLDAGDTEAETYHPKAHFGNDDLLPMESVSHAMLNGAKPAMAVVGGTDVDGDDGAGSTDDDGGVAALD